MLIAKGLSKINLSSGGDVSTVAGGAYALPIQKIEVTSSFSGVITIPNNNNHAIVDLDIGSNSVAGNGSEPIVYNNSNGVTLRIFGSGKIGAGTITGGSFDSVTTDDTVDRTDALVPYSTSDAKDYTLPQTTASKVNGLSTFVTTTTGTSVGLGFPGDNIGAGTGTYTVPQTGRVYFMVQGGGGGGGEWYGAGPGGGAGGGAYGYFNSLSSGDSISVSFGGSGGGAGSNARAGNGGDSTLTISATTLVTGGGGLGKLAYSGTGGVGGGVTVITSNATYPITSVTARSGTSGVAGPGGGGSAWFTQDGETDYQWRNTHIGNNPGSRWTSGTNKGWGDGGGGGAANRGGNSGAPGIVFLWQDAYSSTNAGDPYYPSVKCFTGTGVTTNSEGTPTSGVSLTSFTGEYTRAEL